MDAYWRVATARSEPGRVFFACAPCDPFPVHLLPCFTTESALMLTSHAHRRPRAQQMLIPLCNLTFTHCASTSSTQLLRKLTGLQAQPTADLAASSMEGRVLSPLLRAAQQLPTEAEPETAPRRSTSARQALQT